MNTRAPPYSTAFCRFGGNYIIFNSQNFNKLLVQNVKKIKNKNPIKSNNLGAS
jgi:hypothetical protein